MLPHVYTEYEPLQHVIMGHGDNFVKHPPINVVQAHYYRVDPPDPQLMHIQFEAFVETLTKLGVTVHRTTHLIPPEATLQVFTRDVGMVIGERLVLANIKPDVRRIEMGTFDKVVDEMAIPNVVSVGDGVVEGGDVMLDGNTVYIGISQRTDESGVAWLKKEFSTLSERELFPIKLQDPFLHLDVVFNIVAPGIALIYPPAIDDASLAVLRQRYRLIEVTESEQFQLGVNAVAIDASRLIMDRAHTRIAGELAAAGLDPIGLDYSELRKLGGSFRCCTCPLVRG